MDNRKDSIVAQVAGHSPEEVVAVDDHRMEGIAQKMGETEFVGMLDDARDATNMEHSMTIREAVKLYPYAVAWSILASTALVMEGYDLVVIGSFYGFPAFQRKYGVPIGDGKYSIEAAWQSGLSNGANVGEIIGLMFTGYLAERFGYRKTICGALIMVTCFIFITFFAPSIEVLLVGEILCGLPWGVFQTITTAYAAEVVPVPLRHVLTTYVNLCWVFGQFVGSGVLRGLVTRTDEWAYRIPFALQWMWPIPLFIGMILAPESPWWLVRRGRLDDAKKSLRRLTAKGFTEEDTEKTVAMMVHTNEMEIAVSSGTSYWDCFKGTDLRRTEIASMAWMIQTLCGSGLMGASTQFYEQAGLSNIYAFDLNMAQYCIGAIGTVASWWAMTRFGRRTLYIGGLVAIFVVLMIVGFLAIPGPGNTSAAWATGSMLLIFTFIYDFTVGPVCYCLVAEVSSIRLRQKTIVLARNFYNIIGIINNILTPHMLNATGWNWRGYSGFFWAGVNALCIVWCYFRLVEPKGKTFAEMDILFESKVSARKFATTAADPFRGEHVQARNGSIVRVDSSGETVEKQNVRHNEKF